MRVLLLTQYYMPEPAEMFSDLARSLRANGHTVQVLTGFPCYPLGKTYVGYRQRPWQNDVVDGVRVMRVPQFPDHGRSAIRRALYYLSFAISAATIGLFCARRADVILVYQSAMPIGFAAWIISRVKRIPYVLNVVDLWPESVAASGMLANRFVLGIIRQCMMFIYRGAARINVITEGYRDNLLAAGIPDAKLSQIHCWSSESRIDRPPTDLTCADAVQLTGRFNIMYAGIVGPVQDLRVVVDAAMLLRDLPQVQFVVVGDGIERDRLVAYAAERGAANVRFFSRRTPEAVRRLFLLADVLLVHLKSDPMSSISIPSKTFSYLAAGRPVLMGVEGEASRLIERHRCGRTFRPSDSQSLANEVRHLALAPGAERDRMAQAARSAHDNHYRSEVSLAKLEALLAGAASAKTARQLRAA